MMIKRRLGETAKNRRPPRCTKKSENIYNSTLLYLKFVLVWGGVLLLDFLLDVRFEYLWPVWLFVQSVHDTYKYQGLFLHVIANWRFWANSWTSFVITGLMKLVLKIPQRGSNLEFKNMSIDGTDGLNAFSLFFSCLSLTSDVICSYAIRDDWIFFLASSYVWVQYVWHTERGICFPTVALWFIFVYVEAAIRLKDLSKDMSHRVNLCRPFAAHSIGYPVVTLGFGFKSYISYKLRLRKQVEVQKENEFYFQLLKQALPKQNLNFDDPVYEDESNGNVRANGHIPLINGMANGLQWRFTNSNRDHPNERTVNWVQNNPIPSSNGVLPNASNHSTNSSGGGWGSGGVSSFVPRPRVSLWNNRPPSNDSTNSGPGNKQNQNSTDSTPSSNANSGGKHISQVGAAAHSQHSTGSSPNSSPQTQNSSHSTGGGGASAGNPSGGGAGSNSGNSGGGVLSPSSTPKNPILAVKQIATAITGGSCMSPTSSFEASYKNSPQELSKKSSFCDSKNDDSSHGHQQNGTIPSSNSGSNSGGGGGGGNSRNNQSRQTGGKKSGGGGGNFNNYSSPRESKKRGGGGNNNSNNHSSSSDGRSLGGTNNNNNWLEPNHNLISTTSATAIENLTDAEKVEKIEKLEMTVKALNADLSAKSLVNQELSSKLNSCVSSERQMKQEVEQLRSDKKGLEERITDLSSQKVAANQKVEILEKRIEMERKAKLDAEKRISEEKLLAKRKAEDEISRFVAEIAKKNECTSTNCSKKLKEVEGDKMQIQNELARKNERMQNMEQEIETLRLLRDELSEKGREIARVQELNSRLENNLSIENKYKMELFSALNDCNRKINNFQVELASKNKEIMELQYRNTFAAGATGDRFPFMAVAAAAHNGPVASVANHPLQDNTVVAPGGGAPTQFFLPPQVQTHVTRSSPINLSNLNPEAMVYSPVSAAAVSSVGSVPGVGGIVPNNSNPNVVLGGPAVVNNVPGAVSGAIVSGVGVGPVSSVSNVSPSDITQ